MSLWFVTPAWKRVELSQICFEQRRQVMDELAEFGIETQAVVVADDENLDIARGLGFHTVERDNEFLGRKFNDGIEYAAKHGAEWIVPIGSDSWIDPAYFLPLPDKRVTRTSGMYAPVEAERLAELNVGMMGAGPHVIHRSLLQRSRFRPEGERINHNTDHSLIKALGRVRWERRDIHPLQYVGFRVRPLVTEYHNLWRRWGVVERMDPWERLALVYPLELVARVKALMA